jgi:16S rRNA (cytosine1402-N4)-methyltransferase
VNYSPEKELLQIFGKCGEERRFGKRISRAILAQRKQSSIETTGELFAIIKQALPAKLRFRAPDTARRIFQALRIEVNDELVNLERGLQQAVDLLKVGGRLVVISFHSLEDRIVKNFFVQEAKNCVCPPEFPECRCDAQACVKIMTKKPVMASDDETKANPRSRSAKLRAAERI